MDPMLWCRDRLLVPGNPLTATLLFADSGQRDRILALRTLVGELGAAVEASEGQVAQTKLDWWRAALAGELPAAKRHPAIQALSESGALERLDPGELASLIDAIAGLLDNPRFERMDELWSLCQRIGGQALVLEGGLIGDGGAAAQTLRELGAAGYLVRLVRDIAIDARANRWWVPLELQADYQVARADVAGSRASRGFDGLVRTLIHEAIQRAEEATAQLPEDRAWPHRHALIYWALDRRLGSKLARRPARLLERRLLTGHAGNVVTAWRAARALRRRREKSARSR
jgi:phytoene synthase